MTTTSAAKVGTGFAPGGGGTGATPSAASLKAHLDIVAVIGGVVKLSGGAGSAVRRGKCPFHQGNSSSFVVVPGKRFAHCFGCGWSGDVIRFRMDHAGESFIEALAALSENSNLHGPACVQRTRQVGPARSSRPDLVSPVQMARWLWRQARRDDDAARRYFCGRGIAEAVLGADRLGSFRFLAQGPVLPWIAERGPHSVIQAPMLLALVEDEDGTPLGLHATFLNPDGTATLRRRKPWAKPDDDDPWLPKRKMLGPVGRGAVRLGRCHPDRPLFVGEGNETVLGGMAVLQADDRASGLACLSLNNLQGHRPSSDQAWHLWEPRVDPERAGFALLHCRDVTGLIDADMAPLRRQWVQDRRKGPVHQRDLSGLERAQLCAAMFAKSWRMAGAVRVRALRPMLGQDFNDAAALSAKVMGSRPSAGSGQAAPSGAYAEARR